MTKHPNAVVGGTAGGGGVLVVFLLGLLGVEIDPVVAAVIAGSASTAALLVGRKGIRGIARSLWRGAS